MSQAKQFRLRETNMFRQRAYITLAVSVSLFLALAVPAQAGSGPVQKKSVSGPHGRSGSVARYAERGGIVSNSVTLTANDSDGPGGQCTETWVDYSTKPHLHFNPGVFVNCSGGSRSVSGFLKNDAKNVAGVGIVVCEVPDTSGSIKRDSSNCKGSLSAIYLRSGQRYDQFRVKSAQFPSGVQVERV
jgi:hypothetical protein